MLRDVGVAPRGAAERALAGRLSFVSLLAWLLMQPVVVWIGNPASLLLVLTLVTWGVSAIGIGAALLPRLRRMYLLALGLCMSALIWGGLSVFLGLLFFPTVGGSLALWLYWRDEASRTSPPLRPR